MARVGNKGCLIIEDSEIYNDSATGTNSPIIRGESSYSIKNKIILDYAGAFDNVSNRCKTIQDSNVVFHVADTNVVLNNCNVSYAFGKETIKTSGGEGIVSGTGVSQSDGYTYFSNAEEDEYVLTLTPESGYALNGLPVLKADGTTVALEKADTLEYGVENQVMTFKFHYTGKNATKNVVLEADFTKLTDLILKLDDASFDYTGGAFSVEDKAYFINSVTNTRLAVATALELTYYTDLGLQNKTTSVNGATGKGTAPSMPGEYYVVAKTGSGERLKTSNTAKLTIIGDTVITLKRPGESEAAYYDLQDAADAITDADTEVILTLQKDISPAAQYSMKFAALPSQKLVIDLNNHTISNETDTASRVLYFSTLSTKKNLEITVQNGTLYCKSNQLDSATIELEPSINRFILDNVKVKAEGTYTESLRCDQWGNDIVLKNNAVLSGTSSGLYKTVSLSRDSALYVENGSIQNTSSPSNLVHGGKVYYVSPDMPTVTGCELSVTSEDNSIKELDDKKWIADNGSLTFTFKADDKALKGEPTVKINGTTVTLMTWEDYTEKYGKAEGIGAEYSYTCSYTEKITSIEVDAALKAKAKVSAIKESYEKEGVDVPFTISTVKGEDVTWDGNGTATVTYYTDEACTIQTTADNSGAEGTGKAPVNAGNYYAKVVVSETDDYLAGELVLPITIAWTITESMVTVEDTELVYTGEEQKPDVLVKDGANLLVEGTDYVISKYEDNVNVGTAKVFFNGIGSYTGTVTKTFEIAKAELTNVSVTQEGTLTYQPAADRKGEAQTPEVKATADTVNNQNVSAMYSLKEDGTYASEVPQVTKAGEYTVYYKVSAPNHNVVNGNFTVKVDKASQPVNIPAQTLTVDVTKTTIASVPLPEGWTLAAAVDGTRELEIDTEQSFGIVYTAEDAANYETTSATMTVKRVNCTHPLTEREIRNVKSATTTEKGYSGDVYCKICGGLIEAGHELEMLVPGMTISESSLDFGEVTAGYANVTGKEIIITNTGNCEIELENPVAENFVVNALTAEQRKIAVGARVILTVQPKTGLTAKEYTEKLAIKASYDLVAECSLKFVVKGNTGSGTGGFGGSGGGSGTNPTPSVTPSTKPSAEPSIKPSTNSNTEPSVTPSINPSTEPSVTPSINPNTEPSVTPSIEPSTVPSVSPTPGTTTKPNASVTKKVTKPKKVMSVKLIKKKHTKGKKKGSVVVKFKKLEGVSGYTIEYSKNKKFKKGVKKVNVKKTKTSGKIKNLKKGTYYIRVKGYVKNGSKKIYGAASEVVKLKIK